MTDMPVRDDIIVKPYAISLGFTPEVDNKGFWKEDVPFNTYSYDQRNYSLNPEFNSVRVWKCHKGWAVAKLSNPTKECPTGRYFDHGYFDKVEIALDIAYGLLPHNFGIAVIEHQSGLHYVTNDDGEMCLYTLCEARERIMNMKKDNEPSSNKFTLVQQREHT